MSAATSRERLLLRRLHGLAAALRLHTKAAPWALPARTAVVVGQGAAPICAAWLTKLLFDRLTGGASARTHHLLPLVLALAALGAATASAQHLARLLDREIERKVGLFTQAELFGAVVRDPGLARVEDPAHQDRLQIAQQYSRTGPAQLTGALLGILQGTVTAAGFLVSLLDFSAAAAGLVLLSALPVLVAQLRLSRVRGDTVLHNSPRRRRQLFYSMLLTDQQAAKEIRLFGLGGFFKDRLLHEFRAEQAADRAVDRMTARTDTLLSLMTAVVSGAVLALGVSAAAHGRESIGELSVLIAALAAVQGSLAGIVSQLAVADQSLNLFEHFLAVVEGGPEESATSAVGVPALHGAIRFEDVWFRYREDSPWVLSGIDLTLDRGRAVALVGMNGAGKSTVVKLLCRLYEPTKGRITWDGRDIREFDPAELRRRIGTVFQDHVCYELSARDNIALGDLSARQDDVRLRTAAARAGVDDVVQRLPQRYDTMLSRMFRPDSGGVSGSVSGGTVLSGGQWQRLALARALLREQADLLILDEPSSGLDARAEHQVHRMLATSCAGQTRLMVSHRLNTVREADVILVLGSGRVEQSGTHTELMAAGGAYAELFRLQAEGYRDRPPDRLTVTVTKGAAL